MILHFQKDGEPIDVPVAKPVTEPVAGSGLDPDIAELFAALNELHKNALDKIASHKMKNTGDGSGRQPGEEDKKFIQDIENLIEFIAKREEVNPKEGEKKYGDVPYADERNKKYPLDEKHIHAAISYWGMSKNREKYSPEDQKTIGARIRKYAKIHGVELADDKD